MKEVPPSQRLAMVAALKPLPQKAQPVRRALGIPTMFDRAAQALVKLALEPEWEAKFEADSYGFRPGRSAHDAIQKIHIALKDKSKYVLDADIEACFDRIDHEALLAKLKSIASIAGLVRKWLKAGIFEKGKVSSSEAGTPQGGVMTAPTMLQKVC